MTDIREKVESDRGLLKRIQLILPGFRGYRQREDMRQADSILRIQLADGLVRVEKHLEGFRGTVIRGSSYGGLEDVGGLIFEVRELEGQIRHAEQGYSGISPAVRIGQSQLNQLYEYDLALLDGVKALEEDAQHLSDSASGGKADVPKGVDEMREKVRGLGDTFQRRLEAVTDTEVMK